MEMRYKYFIARLREEVQSRGHGSKAEIANNSGCQGAFIGQILKRNAKKRASLKLQKNIAEYISGNEDRFFDEGQQILETGCISATTNQTPLEQPTCQNCKDEIINKKLEIHQKLVGRFEHQDVAIEINEGLLKLEKLQGRDILLEIKGTINQLIRDAEKKTGADIGTGTEGKL